MRLRTTNRSFGRLTCARPQAASPSWERWKRRPTPPPRRCSSSISTGLPGTSPQAVYLVLNDLTRAGLIRKFEPAGSAALYERRIGDNHHHLICESCGTVQDVDCAVGQAPCLTPSGGEGFRVREAEVTFWGVCATCQSA